MGDNDRQFSLPGKLDLYLATLGDRSFGYDFVHLLSSGS